MLLTFSKTKFVQLIKDGTKVHTIRADKGNRWKVGSKIHFWSGNPRNTRAAEKPYPFGIGIVSRIDQIKIHPLRNYIIIGGIRFSDPMELYEIAINDGFETWEEMKTFFPDVFEGKLIFWKNCNWV
jgi:hypothetical protein